METWKTSNSQNNFEKEEQSWKKSHSLTSDYTAKLQQSKQYDTGRKMNTSIKGPE